MKLKPLVKSTEAWLQEFDTWITPYLDDIKDSVIFSESKAGIINALELVGSSNGKFSAIESASPSHITDAVIDGISGLESKSQESLLYSVINLLFLVTGKTDNNLKCQFPVYLKDILGESEYASTNKQGKIKLSQIPRVISSQRWTINICQLSLYKPIQKKLLLQYISFILNEEIYQKSFYAIGKSYFVMKENGSSNEFLLPLITFFVRGSASATGGHKPENILRNIMSSWGLLPNEDYNKDDIIINIKGIANPAEKTRAYDFVLPYKVIGWDNRICIQSQFYAGDSGSVSHKNVDQTKTSRIWIKSQIDNPMFVEYVDGAGYYSSLNGDLRKLLVMPDTENFFQVRSSPIKLRQLLQSIGFLTPLELVHALSICDLDLVKSKLLLGDEGYSNSEIERVVNKTLNLGLINDNRTEIDIDSEFRITARRYLLLDGIVNNGLQHAFTPPNLILVPGYGQFYGLTFSDVGNIVIPKLGLLAKDWANPATLLSDVEYLTLQKLITS